MRNILCLIQKMSYRKLENTMGTANKRINLPGNPATDYTFKEKKFGATGQRQWTGLCTDSFTFARTGSTEVY